MPLQVLHKARDSRQITSTSRQSLLEFSGMHFCLKLFVAASSELHSIGVHYKLAALNRMSVGHRLILPKN